MRTREVKLTKEQKDFLSRLGSTPAHTTTDKAWVSQYADDTFIEELIRLKQVRWVDGELEPFATNTW